MNAFIIPGCRVRLPVSWSMTSQSHPAVHKIYGYRGWSLNGCNMLLIEVFSLDSSHYCVVSVYLCHSWVPPCVLVRWWGYRVHVIWDHMLLALGCRPRARPGLVVMSPGGSTLVGGSGAAYRVSFVISTLRGGNGVSC